VSNGRARPRNVVTCILALFAGTKRSLPAAQRQLLNVLQ